MIDYVGCISKQDAALLRVFAMNANRILEYGAGASTQIFAAYAPAGASIDCFESSTEWIRRTLANLERLGIPGDKGPRLTFSPPDVQTLSGEYDLIFVDGPDETRQPFALAAWPFLAVGGIMAFHDTRRITPHGDALTSDHENVCWLLFRYWREVDNVSVNACESNTTCVTKRPPLHYEDWQKTEGRTNAQMGLDE